MENFCWLSVVMAIGIAVGWTLKSVASEEMNDEESDNDGYFTQP